MAQARKDILNGWKEIANYVGRDLRTVERWEKQRGLPIHRLPGSGRATVYAHAVELDKWFASAKRESPDNSDGLRIDGQGVAVLLTTSRNDSSPAPAAPQPGQIQPETQAVPVVEGAERTAVGREAGQPKLLVAVVVALIVSGAVAWVLAHRTHLNRAAAGVRTGKGPGGYSFDAARTTPGVPYPSVVSGVDDLYLRGIYSFEQRTAESLKRSEEYFTEATAKDPNFAPAYAGLSDTYNLMREYSVMPDAEAYPKARVAAERAVALDPKLPHAHASLGFIDYFWLADPVASDREFQTALQLDPSQAQAHHWYGSVLTHEGRYAEALVQLDVAQRLQPTSEAILCSRALALGLSGHRGEATDMLQELLKGTPNSASPHRILAILSMMEPRDIPRWLDESRRVAQIRHDPEGLQINSIAQAAYHSGGEPAMWKAVIEIEDRLHPPPQPRPYSIADAEALLGNREAAFAILLPLAKRRDPVIMAMPMDPALAGLRDDPRFAKIMADAGIPPPSSRR